MYAKLPVVLAAAAALSPAAAQKYAPGTHNICTSTGPAGDGAPVILWQADICRQKSFSPVTLPHGRGQVTPSVCCEDVVGVFLQSEVIQDGRAVCSYQGIEKKSVVLNFQRGGRSNSYMVTVSQGESGIDTSNTSGTYSCRAV